MRLRRAAATTTTPPGAALRRGRARCATGSRARGPASVDVGIGVSAGEAVAGNIGAAERFEYTVIGDPVNEAARLTELAKRPSGPRARLARRRCERAGAATSAGRWELGDDVELRGRGEPTRVAAPSSEASVGGSRHG